MLKRALASFRAQTYEPKTLLLLNSGKPLPFPGYPLHLTTKGESIGALRNLANGCSMRDVIVHFDDDDWSHPNRIAEQVALLQASGAEAVGYNEMLFWRTPQEEAWLYRNPSPNYAIGTSLCYWSETWKRKPFPDLPRMTPRGASGSEDREWIRDMKVEVVTSIKPGPVCEPRMIAAIHGGNSMPYDLEDLIARGATEWQRVPEWDEHCRKVMAL